MLGTGTFHGVYMPMSHGVHAGYWYILRALVHVRHWYISWGTCLALVGHMLDTGTGTSCGVHVHTFYGHWYFLWGCTGTSSSWDTCQALVRVDIMKVLTSVTPSNSLDAQP